MVTPSRRASPGCRSGSGLKIGLKKFTPFAGGWKDVDFEMDPHGVTHANTSMHHSREQVAALLPMLQRFVETREIDDTP